MSRPDADRMRRRPRSAGRRCIVAPAFAPDVVNVALDLMLDGEKGARHLANPGLVSAPAPEGAPAYAILGTERGVLMPTLEDVHARLAERAIVPTEESAVERAG